jgi:hypothetical protein
VYPATEEENSEGKDSFCSILFCFYIFIYYYYFVLLFRFISRFLAEFRSMTDVQTKDVLTAVSKSDTFDFLIDVISSSSVPVTKQECKPPEPARGNLNRNLNIPNTSGVNLSGVNLALLNNNATNNNNPMYTIPHYPMHNAPNAMEFKGEFGK